MKIVLTGLPLPLAIGESTALLGVRVVRASLFAYELDGGTPDAQEKAAEELRRLAALEEFETIVDDTTEVLNRAFALPRRLQAAGDRGEPVSAAMVAEARRLLTETVARVVA